MLTAVATNLTRLAVYLAPGCRRGNRAPMRVKRGEVAREANQLGRPRRAKPPSRKSQESDSNPYHLGVSAFLHNFPPPWPELPNLYRQTLANGFAEISR